MKAWLALLGCAACPACGDNTPGPACTATFSGGFADTTSSPAVCPMLAEGQLVLAIDSRVLGAEADVVFELGASPALGRYSSQTLATWHAVEARSLGGGACVYSAGDSVTPHGSFTLELTAIGDGTAHGVLDVVQYVHAVDGTDCGPADLEMLHVEL